MNSYLLTIAKVGESDLKLIMTFSAKSDEEAQNKIEKSIHKFRRDKSACDCEVHLTRLVRSYEYEEKQNGRK